MKKIIVIMNTALLFVSCGNGTATEQDRAEHAGNNVVTLTGAQYKNAGIETGRIETRNISSVLKVNGKIDVPPQSMVSISARLGGYVTSTRLLPGMHIRKGEVLAVMEDPQYIQLQQDYLTAGAQFAFTESEYKRQQELNASKAASDKIFEQARATYQTQYVLIRSLEEKLRLIGLNPGKLTAGSISRSINIYSPITGFVSAVNVNTGKYVNPSDVLFELVSPDDIHLTLTVFEKDISKLAIGQKLWAYTNTDAQKKYPCTIILISKSFANANATQVHCHFEQYDENLFPGMFMNADIEISGSNTTVLPEEAVVRFENRQYIFASKGNNRFEMLEVQTGSSENGYTEIMNAGKLPDQTFVTKGAYNLLMALKNVSEE